MTRALRLQPKLALAALAVLAAHSAWADGYRNPPESASALGRAGGKIADTDNASAVTINPANMADAEQPSVMVSTTIGYAKRQFTGPTGIKEESTDPWGILPSVYGVMPMGDSDYVFGIGLTLPFGRSTTWRETATFAHSSPYFAELRVLNVNPGIATRLTETLSAGVGGSLYVSDITFKQKYPWAMFPGTAPNHPDGTARFEGDGTGYGFNAGLRWEIAWGHVLGLTYRSPFDITYDGSFEIGALPPSAAALGAASSSDFETKIKFPTIIGVGYGLPVTESLRIAFDLEWAEHSRNKSMPVDIGRNSFLLPSDTIPQDWEDNWSYGFGLEWQWSEALSLRGGLMYLETPTPTRTLLPVGSEEDAPILSIGCGYRKGGHMFDIAYAVGFYSGRTVTDNVNPALNGKYDADSHLLGISYAYTF